MDINRTNFFRAVLTSTNTGNNKSFTIDYSNGSPDFRPGRKAYCVVEHFSTANSTDSYVGGTAEQTPIRHLHVFLNNPQINSYDTYSNSSATHLVSVPVFLQLANIVPAAGGGDDTNNAINYYYSYNNSSIDNGVIMSLPNNFTISLDYLSPIAGPVEGTAYNDWFSSAIKGFTLVLRFYLLD